LLKWRGGRAA